MTKRSFIYLFLIALIFTGCSKYGYVTLNYPLAPEAYLPDNIKTIAIVNRSLTKEEDKTTKILEAIKTGEIAGSDRVASDECLKGVFDVATNTSNFTVVFPAKTRFYGTGTRQTPELLDWETVRAICDSSEADALLVLENFDSNTDLLLTTVSNQINTVANGGVPKPSLPSQIRMNVLCYWRLYNPYAKSIIDQYQSKDFLIFNGMGQNFSILPPEALTNTAYAAGQNYIRRFLPSYYTVKRELYKRGKGASKQAFKAAFRCSEFANWQGAIDKWKEIVNRGNRKSAGRACLSIAVSYEVLGNTDMALQWAKRAYEDYNNKLARDYANILRQRQNAK